MFEQRWLKISHSDMLWLRGLSQAPSTISGRTGTEDNDVAHFRVGSVSNQEIMLSGGLDALLHEHKLPQHEGGEDEGSDADADAGCDLEALLLGRNWLHL